MFKLKPINAEAIPRALERAERYRLLNEPWEAESICRDVLGTDETNQKALVSLLLSLTDQFGSRGVSHAQAEDLLPRLRDTYERAYYAGVICERWAKSALVANAPGALVYEWFTDAMTRYEKAEALSPPGNDDAVLRWNACVRQIHKNGHLQPDGGGGFHDGLGDHIPPAVA